MSFLNKPVVGIDIGRKTVKMAECTFLKSVPWVNKAYLIDLPDDTDEDSHLHVALDAIAKSKKKHGMSLGNVAIVCPRNLYSSFSVSLPQMPKKELMAALKWEVNKVTGAGEEEYNFDYYPNVAGKDETEYKVYYALREKIDALCSMFAKYGITLKHIDVEDLTFVASVNALYTDDGSPKGIFDMGYTQSKIILTVNGNVKFTRDLSYNLKTLYERVKRENISGIDYKDAIEIKGCNDETVGRILNEYLIDTVYEISRSVDFFSANFKLIPPTNIFLSGGVFRIPGVCDIFSKNLPYNTTLNNVLDAITAGDRVLHDKGFMFNLAVGVALR